MITPALIRWATQDGRHGVYRSQARKIETLRFFIKKIALKILKDYIQNIACVNTITS